MEQHYFVLVLEREPTHEEYDKLFRAGCDDGFFGVEQGLNVAEFDRESPSRQEAIASATSAVESVGIKVINVLDKL